MQRPSSSLAQVPPHGQFRQPIVLAYPRIYERLIATRSTHDFDRVVAKCFALASHPPQTELGREHRGFLDLGECYIDGMLGLYTLWSSDIGEPDIFLIFGAGDGFGPGDSCPTSEELRRGIYGLLKPVALL